MRLSVEVVGISPVASAFANILIRGVNVTVRSRDILMRNWTPNAASESNKSWE